jgi:hypothetical protein
LKGSAEPEPKPHHFDGAGAVTRGGSAVDAQHRLIFLKTAQTVTFPNLSQSHGQQFIA